MKMNNNRKTQKWFLFALLFIATTACKSLQISGKTENKNVPASFIGSQDTTNIADIKWKDYFTDPNLTNLIDTALNNNQELNIMLLEIQVANNEILAKKGAYLPFLTGGAMSGVDKTSRYTIKGSSEANLDIVPGKATPEPLGDLKIGAFASWEIDIWHKLRNAKKAAYQKYLSSVEGKNFMVTNLVAEIANSYYELLALDNQLDILKQNIEIQNNALNIVRLEKEATRVTELAVRKFEAEVYHTKSLQFEIQQKIVETENRINFLVGRFPQTVVRNKESFNAFVIDTISAGIPSQLLNNRTDIRQAEMDLMANKLDVKVAKAEFYPSFNIRAGVGLQAFNARYFLNAPQSILYSMAGDLVAPLLNRAQLKAAYYNANAKQIQSVFNYEQKILNAFVEVSNQLSNIKNLKQSYNLKNLQVDALNQSVNISTSLFASARADYMEVLLTQRDALTSKFELIDTKKDLLLARVKIYKSLGGGWK
jgi:NodT family efflux transporter outer membrane factor (OMF) lipoprotein